MSYGSGCESEIIEMIHSEAPDLPVRVLNGVLRRQDPQLLAILGEVQPAGDMWTSG
jgi:hypothetical protein